MDSNPLGNPALTLPSTRAPFLGLSSLAPQPYSFQFRTLFLRRGGSAVSYNKKKQIPQAACAIKDR